MDESELRLRECFRAVFPDLSEEEIPFASVASVGEWDSVAALSLLTLVEEQMQIQIPTDQMLELISYELILDYIKSRKDAS
jgi:acyl carrier protein